MMKIGIHHYKGSFSERWIAYCEQQGISYKLVNCYQNDIISQLIDCGALMWHFHHEKYADHLFAKQLLTSVKSAGKIVFPDFDSYWHFDDKVAQKYLLEALNIPLVTSYVFYNKNEAKQWAAEARFPVVFKLREGSASNNVKLLRNQQQAKKYIKKAFGKGFPAFDKWGYLRERIRKTSEGIDNWTGILKGLGRLFIKPGFARLIPNQKGYIYFQKFIPGNKSDTRIIVIEDKAFAIKRMVRANDFRASGSGFIKYEYEEFDERCIQIAFEASNKLQAGCMTYDFIFDQKNQPLIVEISYGFKIGGYDPCEGYWDINMHWHPGRFNPQTWMVDSIVNKVK